MTQNYPPPQKKCWEAPKNQHRQIFDMAENPETTDLTLFVRTSAEEVAPWNRQRIIDALAREADIDYPLADEISREVERQIIAAGIGVTTTALVRELVNVRLIEKGLEKERRLHGRLGFPLYDVRQLILHQNKQDANIPHSPEGTNLLFAEGIKRELSLYDVFSAEIGEAHVTGDIHIHALGYIDRPYSCSQSLEYLKIDGLKLPHAINSANPAKYAEVLLAHMVRFSAVLQGHFAGTIGWDAVNISFAPYLTSMTDREVKQFAQMLIYEFSQLSATRGGQALYTDIHIYYEMPPYWANLPAIGPEGKKQANLTALMLAMPSALPAQFWKCLRKVMQKASRLFCRVLFCTSQRISGKIKTLRSFCCLPVMLPAKWAIPVLFLTEKKMRLSQISVMKNWISPGFSAGPPFKA